MWNVTCFRRVSHLGAILLMGLLCGAFFASNNAQAADFTQLYTRGKLLYKQKLYVDAIKELRKAISLTARGKTHFGAHYYLARAYFWRPDIQQAMATLDKASALVKNNVQKAALKKTVRQIRALYGKVTFVPEVDPDEVGRLQLSLKPKAAFSHKHKKRYYRILIKRLDKQGGLPPSGTIYLPKGEYELGLKRNQCLQYGLFVGDNPASTVDIGSADVSINVKAKQSCKCPSNQIIIKDPKNKKRLTCSCPPGTVWDAKGNECKQAKAPVIWPWILLGVGGGVGVAVAVVTAVVIANEEPTDNRILDGKIFSKSAAP